MKIALNKSRLIFYAALAFVTILTFIQYADLSPNPDTRSFGDASSYIQMSREFLAAVPNPFGLRLLSPTLVYSLTNFFHLSFNATWALVTLGATFAAMVVFFKLLADKLKLPLFFAATFTLFLAYTQYYTAFNYFDLWLVDPVNNLIYALAIYFVFSRRLWAFAITLIVGAVNKEVALLLLPLYPLVLFVKNPTLNRSNKLFWRSVWVALAVVAVYLVYRYSVVHALELRHPGLTYSLGNGPSTTSTKGTIEYALSTQKNQYLVFHVFDFMWVAFAYGLYLLYKRDGGRNDLFVSSLFLLAICLLGRFFATDAPRIFVMAAPLILGVSAVLFAGSISEEQKPWLFAFLLTYIILNLEWSDKNTALLINVAAVALFASLSKTPKLFPQSGTS